MNVTSYVIHHGKVAGFANVSAAEAIVLEEQPKHDVVLAVELHIQVGRLRTEGRRDVFVVIEAAEKHRQALMVFDVQCVTIHKLFEGSLCYRGKASFTS